MGGGEHSIFLFCHFDPKAGWHVLFVVCQMGKWKSTETGPRLAKGMANTVHPKWGNKETWRLWVPHMLPSGGGLPSRLCLHYTDVPVLGTGDRVVNGRALVPSV